MSCQFSITEIRVLVKKIRVGRKKNYDTHLDQDRSDQHKHLLHLEPIKNCMCSAVFFLIRMTFLSTKVKRCSK